MLDLVRRDGNRSLVWSVSDLDLYEFCPRKYFFSRIKKVRFPGEFKDLDKVFGRCVHKILADYDIGIFSGRNKEEVLSEIILSLRGTLLGDKELEPLLYSEDTKYNIKNLLRSLVWYMEIYKEDPFKTAPLPNTAPGIEFNFELPFFEDYKLLGRVDKLCVGDHGLWVLDRKTTSQFLGPWYFRTYALSNQTLGYVWALRKMGLDVKGMIIEANQIAVDFCRWGRFVIPVTQERCDEWYENSMGWIKDAAKLEYRKNTTACGNYDGCPYMEVCAAPLSQQQMYLDLIKEKSNG